MKRSEMNDYIYDELTEAMNMRQYSNETDEKYWRRRYAYLLDMILGFGMTPPVFERAPNKDELAAGIEPEDAVFESAWEPETPIRPSPITDADINELKNEALKKRNETIKVMLDAALDAGLMSFGLPNGPKLDEIFEKVLVALENK